MAKKVDISKVKIRSNKVGSLLFAAGSLIAIVGGLLYPGGLNLPLSTILIALGIVVGLLNVTTKETTAFLLAGVSLVIITSLGGAVLAQIPTIGIYVEGVLLSVLTFVMPAALIVALKSIYTLAQN